MQGHKKSLKQNSLMPNTSAHRSWNMSRIRQKDTKPEMAVRQLVHRIGYRYRLHGKDLPGKPDLVFRRKKKVIFVHGCFWHAHNDGVCKRGQLPKSRVEYWNAKLSRNAERDQENQKALLQSGWKVMTVWQCELQDYNELEVRLHRFLSAP